MSQQGGRGPRRPGSGMEDLLKGLGDLVARLGELAEKGGELSSQRDWEGKDGGLKLRWLSKNCATLLCNLLLVCKRRDS